MGPTVIDTNPAAVSSSFLTTGIWTKLQGKGSFDFIDCFYQGMT